MTALHAATGNPLTRELVQDVRNEITHWLELKQQSYPPDARYLVLDILEELDDHLQIRLATTLASFGIGDPS